MKQNYSHNPKFVIEPIGKTRIIKSLRQDVATAIETESTLVEQPKDAELEHRVIAINKSGEGQPSNTVIVVL